LVPSLGKGKAIVAIARKLLVVVWQVLTHQVADRHADLPMLTRKLQRWGKTYGLAQRHSLSSGAFARQYLRCLGLDPALPPPREGQVQREQGREVLPPLAACDT
jgi:hypothetical protein